MNIQNQTADQIINEALSAKISIGKIESVLQSFGLDWKVLKEQLTRPGGEKTPFYGLTRQDTGKVFATCKEEYSVFQNHELAELCYLIAGVTGSELVNAGLFNGGADVYFQLKLDSVKGIGKNNDTIETMVTGINAHDTTRSLSWGNSDTVISCANTFNRALGQIKHQNKARHTGSMRDKIESSIMRIEELRRLEEEVIGNYMRMAEVPAKRENLIEVVKAVTTVDMTLSADELRRNYTTYNLDRMSELLDAIGHEINQKGETLWGLFNGVTYYTQHIMPVSKSLDARVESKLIGKASLLDSKAYELLSV